MSDLKSSDTKVVPLDSQGKFVLTCPGCAKRFQLLDKAIFGKRVTCKACKAPFFVDGSVVTEFKPADMPMAKPKQSIDSSDSVSRESTPATIIQNIEEIEPALKVVCADTGTVNSTNGFLKNFIVDCKQALAGSNTFGLRMIVLLPILICMGLVNQLENTGIYFLSMWSLQIVFCLACGWVISHKSLQTILLVGCLAPVLWVYAARTAHFEVNWQSQKGVDVTDSKWRWGNKVFHRRIYIPGDFSTEGPIADSGSVHGKWKTLTYKPVNLETEYFWYGEKITEGEWHLRNKR